MGGSAFAHGPDQLNTPRMPPRVYELVRDRCHAQLRAHYFCVASPIESPDKKDFGDVDVLLAWPKFAAADNHAALLIVERAIGAVRVIPSGGPNVSANFAIPWPEFSDGGCVATKFIQVDVRVCDSLEQMQWMLFKHAHGDIWNLLGHIIRSFGLTVDDDALYIRIREIEDVNRKRSKIFLTSDPVEVLRFLGLPIDGFWDCPFLSQRAMFDYVLQCRLFWIRPQSQKHDTMPPIGEAITNNPAAGRAALTSNERRRLAGRPAYRAWIDEFIPQCREKGMYSSRPTWRWAVKAQAITRFGIGKEYARRLSEFLLEKQQRRIGDIIKEAMPPAEPKDQSATTYRSCLIKALKNIIIEGSEEFGVVRPANLLRANGYLNERAVNTFIACSKDTVGRLAFQKHQNDWLEHKQRRAVREHVSKPRVPDSVEKPPDSEP